MSTLRRPFPFILLLAACSIQASEAPKAPAFSADAPPFEQSDQRFKVLVLPLGKDCTAPSPLALALSSAFAAEAHEETLAYRLLLPEECPSDRDEALTSARELGADLVIWRDPGNNASPLHATFTGSQEEWLERLDPRFQEDHEPFSLPGEMEDGRHPMDPDFIVAWAHAMAALWDGDLRAALQRLKDASAYQHTRELYLARAWLLYDLDFDEKGAETLQLGSNMTRQPDQYYYDAGMSFHDRGHLKAAELYITESLSHNPKSASSWIMLSLILNKLDNPEKAVRAAKNALKNDPKSTAAWGLMGKAYSSLGNYEEAENCYRESLEIMSKNFVTRYNLTVTLGIQNKLEEASQEAAKLLEQNPEFAGAHLLHALSKLTLNKPDEALELLRVAAERFPQDEKIAMLRKEVADGQHADSSPAILWYTWQ